MNKKRIIHSICLPTFLGFIFSLISINASAYDHTCSIEQYSNLSPNLVYRVEITTADRAAYNYAYDIVTGAVDNPYNDSAYVEHDWNPIGLFANVYTFYFSSHIPIHAYMYGDGQVSYNNYGGGPNDIDGDSCLPGGVWLNPI